MAEDEGSSIESFEDTDLASASEVSAMTEEAKLVAPQHEHGRLFYNPRLRKDVPRLKDGVEFVDFSHFELSSPPLYELTHSYIDKIILKCSTCSKWAVGTCFLLLLLLA